MSSIPLLIRMASLADSDGKELTKEQQEYFKDSKAANRLKLHQFKAYNSLSQAFLNRLEETYPRSQTYKDMHAAKEKLLTLYLQTVRDSDYLTFDDSLLKLLGCFESRRRSNT